MGMSCTLAAFVSLVFFSYHCSALKYQNGKTYKYTYSTSVLFNDMGSRKLTKAQKDAGLQITLDVDVSPVYQDTDSQLFKLKLNTAKVVSASRENREKPLGSLLKHPVYFQLERNSVGKIFIPQSDPAFCSNIKKGIISLFQVQNEPGERTEVDISGECSVQYTRHTGTTITKTKTDCKNLEIAGQYSNTNKALGVSVWGITTQEYTIEDDIIKKVTGTNKVNSYLNMRMDLNGAATVSQDLIFQSMLDNSAQITASNTEEAIKFLEKETGSTLILSLLPSISESSQCTENCESPLKLIPVLHDDLMKEQVATVSSAKAFIRMLKTFRSSGKDTIAEVLTSKESYLIVPQLIDVAAATQTSAGLKAVMDLLVFDDDYSTDHPERFLLAAAYSTHPGEYLLKELVSILKKNIPSQSLTESLMMATGAIVYTYCQVKDKCTNQIVQDFRSLMLSGLSKCEDEACTGMYLRALGNSGLPDTITTIIVHAEHANTSLLCEMAIKALRRMDKQFITDEVIETMLRIFHENEKSYDTSVRISALNIILQSNPSVTTLRNVLLSITDQTNFELSTFIQLKIHDAAKQDKNLRTTLQSIYQESKINNYNVLAQRGKSSVSTNFLATTSDMHASFTLVYENSNSGVMKRSGMDIGLLGHTWTQPFLDFSIFADGLESLMGEESTEEPAPDVESEEESGVEAMAGMSFTMMDVVLKQVEFFRGMTGLMSAVWNAPSELTSALQGNLLLQDHYQRVHLSNGLIMNVAVTGVLSMDLSGYVSISLWNRNCDSLIRNSGAFYIEGSMQLESSHFNAGVIFTGEGASAIDFMTVADFYEMPIKLCMQMKRPGFTFRQTLTKFERITGLKKYSKKITKTTSFSSEAYFLNKGNSDECKKINEGQD